MFERREKFILDKTAKSGAEHGEIYIQSWIQQKANISVVISHGHGEHSEAYHRAISEMIEKNEIAQRINFYAWDLPGHGRSYGQRGHIFHFDEYVESLDRVLRFLLREEIEGPLVLFGHSMGGLVLSRWAERFSVSNIAGFAFSSPLMGIAIPVAGVKKKLAEILSQWAPRFAMSNQIRYEDLSSDTRVTSGYYKDPLRHDRVSSRLFTEMVEAMNLAIQEATEIKMPCLVQLAGTDRIVNGAMGQKFFEKLASPEKELKIYRDFYHEIFNDLGRELVQEDFLSWVKSVIRSQSVQ